MREPFFNHCISDIALDLGEAFLEAEYEGRNLLPKVSETNLSEARNSMSRRDRVPQRLPVHAPHQNRVGRNSEVTIRRRTMRRLGVPGGVR